MEIGANAVIRAAWPGEPIQSNSDITVAIRPEKVGLFPADGVVRKDEGITIPVDEFKAILERSPDTTVLPATIVNRLYIGTDTRYTVRIGNTELVARVQNFGQRFDTTYKTGQSVYVFWDTQNARILAH